MNFSLHPFYILHALLCVFVHASLIGGQKSLMYGFEELTGDGSSSMPRRNANFSRLEICPTPLFIKPYWIGEKSAMVLKKKTGASCFLFEQTVMLAFSRDTLVERGSLDFKILNKSWAI